MRYSKSEDRILKNQNHKLEVFVSEVPLEISLNLSAVSTFYSFEEEQELTKIIWKGLKKGDMNALGKLYNLYITQLFSCGMEKVHHKAHVMDGIHDFFVDVLRAVFNRSNYLDENAIRTVLKSDSVQINRDSEFFLNSNQLGKSYWG